MADYYEFNDEYGNLIILDEYNGELSLAMGEMGKDGTAYKRWGKLQIGTKDDPKFTKIIPWKIKLGSKIEAVSILYFFLEKLGAKPNGDKPDDDIPF